MWTLETFTAGAKTTALWNIVHTSNLFGDRIDADSYHHEFMQLENLLNGVKTQKLGSIAVIKSGTTPTDRDENLDNGVILLKTANIQDGYIDDNSFSYISDEIDERMRKTSLKDYDIMVNIVGATLDVISRTAPIPQISLLPILHKQWHWYVLHHKSFFPTMFQCFCWQSTVKSNFIG